MSVAHVNHLSCLDKIKGPIKLNLEFSPCIGVCDIPLRPKGKRPEIEAPKDFLGILERACFAEILTVTVIIPDIFIMLNDKNSSMGAIRGKINEISSLFSFNCAVPSEESALKLKKNAIDFSAKLRDFNLDAFGLYISLELLPMVSEEIGKLAKSLLIDSLSCFNLSSDLPCTAGEMESLAISVREIVRTLGVPGINLTLVNSRKASINVIPELLRGLERLGLLATIFLKPPLPFCSSSLLKSKYFQSFLGICPAQNICFTIDASGNRVPCLHKREPSLTNWDISIASWKRYKDAFRRAANFHMVNDCRICEIQKYCGGLCDIWQEQKK